MRRAWLIIGTDCSYNPLNKLSSKLDKENIQSQKQDHIVDHHPSPIKSEQTNHEELPVSSLPLSSETSSSP